MKKTYINPETIVVDLMPVRRFMLETSESLPDPGEGQFTKGYSDAGSSDNTGSKNIWDEEW